MAMSGAMSADPVCIYDASGDEREVAKEEREEGEEEEEENEDEQSDQPRICTARFNLKLSWNQSTTLRLPTNRGRRAGRIEINYYQKHCSARTPVLPLLGDKNRGPRGVEVYAEKGRELQLKAMA
jgi:hypothetical protein